MIRSSRLLQMNEILFPFIKDKIPIPIFRKQRQNGDFSIVMSQDLEIYYLNITTSKVLSFVNNQNTIADITNRLAECFEGITSTDIQDDVFDTVRTLQWHKIIDMT